MMASQLNEHRRSWVATAVAILSVGALLAGCSGGTAPEPSEADDSDLHARLIEAGIEESIASDLESMYEEALQGDTTIHFYGVTATPLEGLFMRFSELFPGLNVVGTQLNSPDTITRVTAEQASGQASGGIVSGTSNVISALVNQFDEFEPLVADDLVPEGKDPTGFYATALTPYGPVYNIDTVEVSDLPSSWSDVLTAEWHDRMSSVDPTVVGVTSTALIYLSDAGVLNQNDLETLAAQGIKYFPDTAGAINAVGSGERDLMFTQSFSVFKARQDAGLPVEIVFPMEDANIVQQLFIAIPKTVPNRAASELLANYLFTADAQSWGAEEQGYIPTLSGLQAAESLVPSYDEIPRPLAGPKIKDVESVQAEWFPILESVFAQ